MKRIVIYLMLVLSVAVFAQQQSDTSEEEPSVSDQADEQVVDNVEGDAGQGPEDEDPPNEDAPSDVELLIEDELDDEFGDEEVYAEEIIDEEIGDEVLDADEADILPDEEISEDYPVPLPSDI
jgi:hypothetical protein